MVAVAFIDSFLRGLLTLHFVDLSKNDFVSIFGPERPLASFSAKIKICHAFGLIGAKTAHDLNVLREVRNAFAHGLRKMNFKTREVRDLLLSCHCVKDVPHYKKLSSRKLFFEVVSIISTHIGVKQTSSPAKAPIKLQGYSPFLD
jgi:DNA-binding MltR family transcriptional regulator